MGAAKAEGARARRMRGREKEVGDRRETMILAIRDVAVEGSTRIISRVVVTGAKGATERMTCVGCVGGECRR